MDPVFWTIQIFHVSSKQGLCCLGVSMSKYNLVKAASTIFIKANLAIDYFLRVVCIQENLLQQKNEEHGVIYYFLIV